MQLGKYFWIWKLDQCEGGNIAALVARAKALGLAGYIIKVNDGSGISQWANQIAAIKQLKAAGLSVGAWGYSYAQNLIGEVAAVKVAVEAGADFYVVDAEKEYAGARTFAENLLKAIKQLGVPIGYTSYAIPSYHANLPWDIFSKYCDFTMPQIYWATMGWAMDKAFWTSIEQYKAFGIPVYPLGQAYDKATLQDIQAFNKLCRDYGADVISYWDYQHATAEQLAATVEGMPKVVPTPPDEFTQNIIALKAAKIIDADSNHKPDEPVTWAALAKVTAKLIK